MTYVWWAIGLALTVAAALIILLSRKREDVHQTMEKRALGAEGLVKTRDTELGDCKKLLEKALEDKGDVDSEYKALAGINIEKLFRFWQEKERIEADLEMAQSEVRRLKVVLKRYEEQEAGK